MRSIRMAKYRRAFQRPKQNIWLRFNQHLIPQASPARNTVSSTSLSYGP